MGLGYGKINSVVDILVERVSGDFDIGGVMGFGVIGGDVVDGL